MDYYLVYGSNIRRRYCLCFIEMKSLKCSKCEERIPQTEKKAMLKCKVVCQRCFIKYKISMRIGKRRSRSLMNEWIEFQRKQMDKRNVTT